MVRTWWLGALLVTAVSAQEPEASSRTSVSGTSVPGTSVSGTNVPGTSTAEMMRILNRLEPKAGWEATPPGIADDQWNYYRSQFRMAPKGNKPDVTRIGLGQLLFFDKRLSRDRTVSCATCHNPKHGFTDAREKSIGIDGQLAARNAPTVMNAGLQRSFFWDGRAETLEEQAAGPILNPTEMGMPNRAAVVERIREVPEYAALFEFAYGRAPEFEDITRALAAFQRTLVFLDSPFDEFRTGKKDAISLDAQKGFELFRKHCTSCHPVSLREPLFSDGNFHNVGVGFETNDHQALGREAFPKLRKGDRDPTIDTSEVVGKYGELGRALITKLEYQVGSFRTAPLRNIALTAPYMHNGSLDTLWDVVDHYNEGGIKNTWQDPQIRVLGLSDVEIDQVVAFLFSLTDKRFEAENQRAYKVQRPHVMPAKGAK
ncbi:MAG: cytochrome c peroxidase [Planctomycetota bacterium]|jgi:cytochrome c peroxidase